MKKPRSPLGAGAFERAGPTSSELAVPRKFYAQIARTASLEVPHRASPFWLDARDAYAPIQSRRIHRI